ncbi:MAG: YdcF family protein [Christensenellales bacterium]|jgi:uncharacterized SAM-binding protein YcdF (DUF218 family)
MIKKTFHILLIVIGVVGIIATITVIPVSTSISVGTLLPASAGIMLIAYGFIRLKRPGYIIRNKVLRLVITIVVCLGILSFLAVETLVIASANPSGQDQQADFVIVLGCGIFPNGQLSLTLKNRLDMAFHYLTEHEDTICIVSGGQGPLEPLPEAEAMRDYLVSMGIVESRIITESNSFDTSDNMAFSAKIMRQYQGKKMTAAVVTNDYHIFRSVLLARNNGIDAFGIPAPTPWYLIINCYLREYLGVVKMVLF